MAALKKFFNENFIIISCSAAIAFVLGGFVWAFFALRLAGGETFILHFSDLNGITNVGGLGGIVFMGAFGLLVVLINFAIAREFAGRDRAGFFGKFIATLTLLFAVLLFLAFAAIINVNV